MAFFVSTNLSAKVSKPPYEAGIPAEPIIQIFIYSSKCLTQKDVLNSFRSGQVVNPLERGHIAYRTDDIVALRAHLDLHCVPYSDWGSDAVKGWHQVFFYDPEGNVIEVHQRIDVV